MSNPFGEYDDEEYKSVNSTSLETSTANTPNAMNSVDPTNPFEESTNPFEEDVDTYQTDDNSRLQPIPLEVDRQHRDSLSVSSVHKRNQSRSSWADEDAVSNSSPSRQSLASANSEVFQMVGNYSLGDGCLQKEGLLCPDCLMEFKTITELMTHFEQKHRQTDTSLIKKPSLTSPFSSETPSQVGVQIKDFLNKLISQRLSKSSEGEQLNSNNVQNKKNRNYPTTSNPIDDWKLYMKPGPYRSHFEEFSKIREFRIERYVFETNKLLIRLDKLLRDYPPLDDSVARREHEQSVVDWIDENIVPLCPSCAHRFNILTRKKHHCRLCGAVMCGKCSEFIDFDYAFQLISPVCFDSSIQPIVPQISLPKLSSTANTTFPISKNSLISLVTNSMQSAEALENLNKLRLCINCETLLSVRKEKLDVAHSKPPIVQLYDQMRTDMAEIDRLSPIYHKMAYSLNYGESTYNLRDAIELKNKLTKLGEKADLLSRKIEKFGINKGDETVTITKRQISIQLAIRRATVASLRNCLLALPELPDESKLEVLRARYDQIIQERIRYEKELALKEQQRFKQIRDSATSANTSKESEPIISFDDGFCSQISKTDLWQHMSVTERDQILNESDPLLQQINIIRSYIRQARDNHRYEEVNMLEENLRELEIEYYFNQEQKHSQTSTPN